MTKLYWADISALEAEALFRQHYDRLPPQRREKVDALRFPADKARSLGAWLLLEYALGQWGFRGELRLARNDWGKPFLEGGPHFNLSHSGSRVLCAVSEGEVGCDIQRTGPWRGKVAARFFTGEERTWLQSLPEGEKETGFYRLWTLKESFLKATGLGLSLPLGDFSVLPDDPIRVMQEKFPDRPFFFREWALGEDYRCACCAGDDAFFLPEEIKLV